MNEAAAEALLKAGAAADKAFVAAEKADRAAARKLTLSEYGDPKRKLTAQDIEEANQIELRHALGCQEELGPGRTKGSHNEMKKRLRKFHGVDAPSS